MKGYTLSRLAVAILIGMALALQGVSAVVAAPPPNDNFADATEISVLPYTDSADNTEATLEPDEPQNCDYSSNTVWYWFKPTTDGVFRADMAGSSFWGTTLRVYQATGPGFSDLSLVGCATWSENRVTFLAQAGVTYYFQAGNLSWYSPGMLQFHLQKIPPPSNDNWVNAKLISTLAFDDDVDTEAATQEEREPSPSCGYPYSLGTIWYAFTPQETRLVSAYVSGAWESLLAVYTGNSVPTLTEIGCRRYGELLTFRANAGTTYYFQVARFGGGPWLHFHLEVTPPPVASFYFWPSDPTVFDTVQFSDNSYDPGQVGIQSRSWNLGDGTTATGCCPSHKYGADGDYTVNLAVTTPDGRAASTHQVVHVKTHDVAIVRLGAPQAASAGQTRHIYVDINSNRYEENVQVQLFKSVPGGSQLVGTLNMLVPVRKSNRTTQFDFSYTFTNDDARTGKVTFRAVAIIMDARDALPADNEAVASPTKVNRGSFQSPLTP